MNKYNTLLTSTLLAAIASGLFSGTSLASSFDATEAKLKTAMAGEIRTEAETGRDKNRNPAETLDFFGLRDNMKVIELLPGGGWYTKLLAPVLADKGKLYVAYGTGGVEKKLKDKKGFEKLAVLASDAKLERKKGARFMSASNTGLGVKNVDMVLTFRNYHNFDAKGRVAINASVYKALRSGGVYGVVDHTRRHMQKLDNENGRRVDPVLAIKEIEAAGFEFVDYSTLHYRADDELRYEVGRKSVTGNTDRWTLKFRKP